MHNPHPVTHVSLAFHLRWLRLNRFVSLITITAVVLKGLYFLCIYNCIQFLTYYTFLEEDRYIVEIMLQ